jgi:hypothetical protein
VVVVNSTNERLNTSAFDKLLFAHLLGDLQRVPINTSDDGVSIRALVRMLVVLNHHSLAACEATPENNNYLARANASPLIRHNSYTEFFFFLQ